MANIYGEKSNSIDFPLSNLVLMPGLTWNDPRPLDRGNMIV